MHCNKNKTGSVTVFAMIALSSLIIMMFSFFQMSKKIAVDAAVDSLEQVIATSILAEYDKELYDKYGIFGYYAEGKTVDDKIYDYAERSFINKKYIKWQGAEGVVYDYSLGIPDVFKKQVIAESKILLEGQVLKKIRDNNDKTKEVISTSVHRKISNKELLEDLPSGKYDTQISFTSLVEGLKNLPSLQGLAKKTSDIYLENKYIDTYFRHCSSDETFGKTYFNAEQEYIIGGRPSDDANIRIVKTMIIGVRESLNLAYLNKTPEKTALVDAVAEMLTPGPEAAITREALLSAWALAESINDYKLLIHGKKVPFMKDETSWAIDLDSVVENKVISGFVETNNKKGDSYQDYLNGFFTFINEDTKLLRMEDLIQINMKFNYWENFRMDDFYSGLKIILNVNRKAHEFEKTY